LDLAFGVIHIAGAVSIGVDLEAKTQREPPESPFLDTDRCVNCAAHPIDLACENAVRYAGAWNTMSVVRWCFSGVIAEVLLFFWREPDLIKWTAKMIAVVHLWNKYWGFSVIHPNVVIMLWEVDRVFGKKLSLGEVLLFMLPFVWFLRLKQSSHL